MCVYRVCPPVSRLPHVHALQGDCVRLRHVGPRLEREERRVKVEGVLAAKRGVGDKLREVVGAGDTRKRRASVVSHRLESQQKMVK